MSIIIKKMESDDEIRGKAYVHWKAWQETYSGLISQEYLDNFTLEKCTNIAYRWLDNILVAKDGDKVIGFVGCGPYRADPMATMGEIYSIYILKEYYDKKIGYSLMRCAFERLQEYEQVAVWVLKNNGRAVRFYKRYGFQFDGTEQPILLGTPNTEVRMIINNIVR